MNETEHLDLLVMLVFAVFGGFATHRLVVWVRASPISADPWSPELEYGVHLPEAVPVCPKCITSQPPGQWFCEHCGSAVGDYNNWMPYLREFSQGEVLRNGVMEKFRLNALTIVGYLFFSFSAFALFLPVLVICLPVYWYLFFKNVRRIRQEQVHPTLSEEQG